jgi:hypothetical protein
LRRHFGVRVLPTQPGSQVSTLGFGTVAAEDIIILSNRVDALLVAREISRKSYDKMLQNVMLAFMFNRSDRSDLSGVGDGGDGRERYRDLLQLALGTATLVL